MWTITGRSKFLYDENTTMVVKEPPIVINARFNLPRSTQEIVQGSMCIVWDYPNSKVKFKLETAQHCAKGGAPA